MGILQFDELDDIVYGDCDTALGDLPTSAYTLACGVRHDNVAGNWDAIMYLFTGFDATGTAEAGISHSGSENNYFADVGGGGSSFASTRPVGDTDYVLVLRKAAGTVAPILSIFQAGSTWEHITGNNAVANQTACQSIGFSTWEAGADPLQGWLAWFAAWSGAMSQANAEALVANWRTSDLYNSAHGTPVALVEFNTDTPVDLMGTIATLNVGGGPTVDAGQTFASWDFDGIGGPTLVQLRPDADIDAASWDTAPLWSKIDEVVADATVVTDTAVESAFPAIQGTPAESAQAATTTSHVVALPASIAAGELLLVIMAKDATATTINALAGWNELIDENVARGLFVAYRTATGGEGASVTFTSAAAIRSAAIAYRISGQNATLIPQISAVATGTSQAPNPNSLAPLGGAKNYLWFTLFTLAGEEADDDTWTNNAATNYANLLQKTSGTGGTNVGASLAVCNRTNNAASEDAVWPAASIDVSLGWRAFTIAIHPVATQTSVARVSLAPGSTPVSRDSHSIWVRARVTAGSGRMRCALYEGGNNRSTDLENSGDLGVSLVNYELPIAQADAEDITDYSDLEIRFWGYSAGGGAIVYEVDQLWLELPEGAAAAPGPPPLGQRRRKLMQRIAL